MSTPTSLKPTWRSPTSRISFITSSPSSTVWSWRVSMKMKSIAASPDRAARRPPPLRPSLLSINVVLTAKYLASPTYALVAPPRRPPGMVVWLEFMLEVATLNVIVTAEYVSVATFCHRQARPNRPHHLEPSLPILQPAGMPEGSRSSGADRGAGGGRKPYRGEENRQWNEVQPSQRSKLGYDVADRGDLHKLHTKAVGLIGRAVPDGDRCGADLRHAVQRSHRRGLRQRHRRPGLLPGRHHHPADLLGGLCARWRARSPPSAASIPSSAMAWDASSAWASASARLSPIRVFEASLAGGFAYFANLDIKQWMGIDIPWPILSLIMIVGHLDPDLLRRQGLHGHARRGA